MAAALGLLLDEGQTPGDLLPLSVVVAARGG